MTPIELRTERNARLAATDFYMLVDVFNNLSEGDREIVRQYRQALRDLPANYDGKKEVKWHVPPFTPEED